MCSAADTPPGSGPPRRRGWDRAAAGEALTAPGGYARDHVVAAEPAADRDAASMIGSATDDQTKTAAPIQPTRPGSTAPVFGIAGAAVRGPAVAPGCRGRKVAQPLQ